MPRLQVFINSAHLGRLMIIVPKREMSQRHAIGFILLCIRKFEEMCPTPKLVCCGALSNWTSNPIVPDGLSYPNSIHLKGSYRHLAVIKED